MFAEESESEWVSWQFRIYIGESFTSQIHIRTLNPARHWHSAEYIELLNSRYMRQPGKWSLYFRINECPATLNLAFSYPRYTNATLILLIVVPNNIRHYKYVKKRGIEWSTTIGNIKITVILVKLRKHYNKLKRAGTTVQCTVKLSKIYEPNLERSYVYLKQWPSDYYKFWDGRIIEVRFKSKTGYLNILGLYVSKKDETNKQKNFIKD